MSNSSCRKAIQWFEVHDIAVRGQKIRYLTKEDLLLALELSNNGFSDLLKEPTRCNTKIKRMVDVALSLSFGEAVNYILANTEVLKVPLILDGKKLIIGYNLETIRVFIPKAYRMIEILEVKRNSLSR